MTAPLVLLHPLGADRTFWTPVLAHLGDREVLALDLAELPMGAELDDLGALVLQELDRGGVGRFDVVGISLGGLVAQWLGAEHPDRVCCLGLVDTVPTYPDEMREMWRTRASVARAEGLTSLVGPTLAVWFTDDYVRRQGAEVRRAVEVLSAMDPEAYARTCELLEGADLSARLAGIAAPTLVVCGNRDGEPFLAAARSFAAVLPDVRLEWIDGKHAAVLEDPSGFARVLCDFLDTHHGGTS